MAAVKMVLRVGRKGVVVLPKALREAVGVGEGDELLAEVVDGSIVLRPLRPRVVSIEGRRVSEMVERLKREWDERIEALAEKAGT